MSLVLHVGQPPNDSSGSSFLVSFCHADRDSADGIGCTGWTQVVLQYTILVRLGALMVQAHLTTMQSIFRVYAPSRSPDMNTVLYVQ